MQIWFHCGDVEKSIRCGSAIHSRLKILPKSRVHMSVNAARTSACATNTRLHLESLVGLRERLHGVAQGNKFVGYEPLKIQIGNGGCDRPPVHFLGVVQFMPARNA